MIDQLKLRLKYAERKEEALRKTYRERKKSIAQIFSNKPSKYRRMMRSIQRMVVKTWNDDVKKIDTKIEWLKQKFKPVVISKEPKDSIHEWVKSMSEGSGKDRKRAKIEVPILEM